MQGTTTAPKDAEGEGVTGGSNGSGVLEFDGVGDLVGVIVAEAVAVVVVEGDADGVALSDISGDSDG